MTQSENRTYLGLDFSTQQLKGVIINEQLEIIHETNVQFDSVLPEFRTHSGVVKLDKKTVTAPVLMWVKALDLLLDQLKVCGADFSQIAALSGSAQQHGTVYWQTGAQVRAQPRLVDQRLRNYLLLILVRTEQTIMTN